MKSPRFGVSWFLFLLFFTIVLFGIPLAMNTAIAEQPSLQVAEPVAQQSNVGFCGVEFPNGGDLTTVVESLGGGVVLQTFDHDSSPAQWSAQLDLAQNHGLEVVAWLWPEGWEWDGNDWQIDNQARSFIQTVAAHPATLAVYALHEPYWRGCPTCGLTTAQQQVLYQEIKAIADIPLYSEIGSVTYWADQGQDTTLAEGVCDYCAVWYFPFFADGTFRRDEFISHLDDELAAIRDLSPNSEAVWLMQVFAMADHPEPRRMPTAAEIRDINTIVVKRDVSGVFWYVWRFGPEYDDYLSNHPELFPAVRRMLFCDPFKVYLPFVSK